MYLHRLHSWYLPFSININGAEREISKINIFNENGIVVSQPYGYFDSYASKGVDNLEIPVDCVVKRKLDFSLKTAFLMSEGKDMWGNVAYTLYIPAEVLDLDMKETIEANPTHAWDIKRVYTSKVNPLVVIVTCEYPKSDVPDTLSNLRKVLKDASDDVSARLQRTDFEAMIKKITDAYNEFANARAELNEKINNRKSA